MSGQFFGLVLLFVCISTVHDVYIVIGLAFSLNLAAAYAGGLSRQLASASLPTKEAASMQSYVKLGLFIGLVAGAVAPLPPSHLFTLGGLCALEAGRVITAVRKGPDECRNCVVHCMLSVGLVLTATGKVLELRLVSEFSMDPHHARMVRYALQLPFAFPIHFLNSTVAVGGSRSSSCGRGEKKRSWTSERGVERRASWDWGLLAIVVGAVASDEVGDMAKRDVIDPRKMGDSAYLLASALALLLSFAGEKVGIEWKWDRCAKLHGCMQMFRTAALSSGELHWIYLAIAAEDLAGGVLTGAINEKQERATRHSNSQGGWIDWVETVSKWAAPHVIYVACGTLGAANVSYFRWVLVLMSSFQW